MGESYFHNFLTKEQLLDEGWDDFDADKVME